MTTLAPPLAAVPGVRVAAASPTRAAGYVANLDGLRALAILGVLLHHAPPLGDLGGVLAALQANGRYGVALFFVISGYLITTLLRREQRQSGQVALARFFARRSLRLFPLYYATLAVYLVLVLGLHRFSPDNQELFRHKLVAYVFYFANLVPAATQGPFFFAWSLAAEEQFYALFGAAMRWLSPRTVAFAAAAALILKVSAYATLGPLSLSRGILSVAFSYQEGILLGVSIAFLLETRAGQRAGRVLGEPLMLSVVAGTIALLLLAAPIGAHNFARAELLTLAMGALVAGAVAGPPRPMLEHPWIVHVGRVSYGIYLLHMLALDPLRRALPHHPVVVLLAAGGLALGAASAAHRWVEQPISAWRQRWERRHAHVQR